MLLLTMFASAAAEPVEGEVFVRTWARTDMAVLEGVNSRTWMWGPDAISEGFFEPYTDSLRVGIPMRATGVTPWPSFCRGRS